MLSVIILFTIKNNVVKITYMLNDIYYCVSIKPKKTNSITGYVYEYAIFEENSIILEESSLKYQPNINWCNGTIRIETAYGTNHREVRYYNLLNKTLSESFIVPCVYADFLYNDIYEPINLFATFGYDKSNRTVLLIYDIYRKSTIATIYRNFIAPTSGANNILFLNENIICIDYDILDNNENRVNKIEVIQFRKNQDSIIITE